MAIYTPQTVAISNSPKGAQSRIREMMGLSDTPADWQYKDRVKYNDALAAEYAAHPEIYGKHSQAAARYTPNPADLEEYGFFEMAGDFTNEAANQFQQVNPFSEENRTQSKVTLWLIIIAVIVGALAYMKFMRSGAPV